MPKKKANTLGPSQIRYNRAKRAHSLTRAGRMGTTKFPTYNQWMKKKAVKKK